MKPVAAAPGTTDRISASSSRKASGARLLVRPSGTEPKIKFYFDVREPMQDGETPQAAEVRAKGKMAALTLAFSHLAGA